MSAPRLIWLLAAGAVAGCAPQALSAAPGPAPVEDGLASARLGELARFGRLTVTPLRIEEDSRCPTGVQCVQAGTVRIAVRARGASGTREAVLRLDEPQQLWQGTWILLAAVCPHPRFPGAIPREAYRFTFAVRAGSPPAPLDFACPRTP